MNTKKEVISDFLLDKIKEYSNLNNFNIVEQKELKKLIYNFIQIDNEIAKEVTEKNKNCVAFRIDEHLCIGVDKSAIHSHTVAHNELKKIAITKNTENQVSNIKLSFQSFLKNNNPITHGVIATAQASIFAGFCNNDKYSCESKFANIDKFPLNFEENLLFLYRDLGRRIVMMESTLNKFSQYENTFYKIEPFFKFINNDFSFRDWIRDIKKQKIETKSSFLNIFNCIYNKKSADVNAKNKWYDTLPNWYEVITRQTNIPGFILGTGMRVFPNSFLDLGTFDLYAHFHFWINDKGNQCFTFLLPSQPAKNKIIKDLKKNNEHYLYFLVILAILDTFPNVYFNKDYFPLDNIVELLYKNNMRHGSSINEINNLLSQLKKDKIINYRS